MILIKVECGNGVQDSIRECMALVCRLGIEIGTTMDVNGVEVVVMPWNTFDEVYNMYTEDLKNS